MVRSIRRPRLGQRCFLIQALVRTGPVAVANVLPEHPRRMLLVQHDQLPQALLPEGPVQSKGHLTGDGRRAVL